MGTHGYVAVKKQRAGKQVVSLHQAPAKPECINRVCSGKTRERERERGKGACERSGSTVSYRSLLHETAI